MIWQRSHSSTEQNKEDTGNELYGLRTDGLEKRETKIEKLKKN
jgi:hypothetical protein